MSIYDKASLIQIPSGYKAGNLYSVIPNSGAGDFTVTGDAEGDATRVNSQGLIETVNANVPRLNYPFIDGVVQDCPHLLLEPQRTNYITYSEDFSQWNSARGTLDVNNITSPTGSLNGSLYTKTESGNEGYVLRDLTVSSVGTYTASVFFKYNNNQYVHFLLWDGSSNGVRCYFDIQNGNIGSAVAFGTTFSASDLSMEDYGNGWYKCSAKFTTTGTDTIWQFRFSPSGGNNSANSNTGAKFYFFGAQVQQGTYPTSYIQTGESTVTRLVDSCHLLNHSLFTDYPFTVYGKAEAVAIGNTIFSLVDNTSTTEYLTFQLTSATQVAVIRRNPSTSDADYYNFSYSIGDTLKVAISYISNTSYKLYINGTQIGNVTSGSSLPFAYPDIILGQQRVSLDTGTRNSINEFMVFNEALSDSELQTLTTL